MAKVEPEWFVAGKLQVGVGAHGLWMSRCWNAANSLACRDAAAVGAAIGGAPSHELGAETRAEQLGCDGEDGVAIVSACIASAGSLQRAFELIRSEFLVVKEEPVDDGRAQESAQDKDCHSGQQAWPQMRFLRLSELKYVHTNGGWIGTGSERAKASEIRTASVYGTNDNWNRRRQLIHLRRISE